MSTLLCKVNGHGGRRREWTGAGPAPAQRALVANRPATPHVHRGVRLATLRRYSLATSASAPFFPEVPYATPSVRRPVRPLSRSRARSRPGSPPATARAGARTALDRAPPRHRRERTRRRPAAGRGDTG